MYFCMDSIFHEGRGKYAAMFPEARSGGTRQTQLSDPYLSKLWPSCRSNAKRGGIKKAACDTMDAGSQTERRMYQKGERHKTGILWAGWPVCVGEGVSDAFFYSP